VTFASGDTADHGPGATPEASPADARDSSGVNRPVWEDGRWQPLPALTEDATADVCVVGLGAAGLACVNSMLARGLSVIGVDASDVGAGAAGRNGGFLLAGLAAFYHDAVAAHGREFTDAFYRRTMAQLDRIFGELPDVARRTGSLRIAASEEELEDCERQLEAMRSAGLPVEPYEGPEGRGLLIPTDGVFDPLARCRVLARQALDSGGRLYSGTPAREVRSGSVTTPRARISCGTVVVAVDGGLERLLPELEGEVRTARLQMLATAPVRQRLSDRAVYLRYGYEYWQQLPDGRIALGGFRDRGGDAEWTYDSGPGGVVQQELERYLRREMKVTAPITHRWAALVSFTRSGLPVNDEVRAGVHALGGYCGTGNVIGPMLGEEPGSSD
jgi:gamma-glutamylputrescine oxidase